MTKTEFLLTISIQYQYNIKLINNENLKNQSGDYELIQNQILWTNIIRIVSQITIEILGMKGLEKNQLRKRKCLETHWFKATVWA